MNCLKLFALISFLSVVSFGCDSVDVQSEVASKGSSDVDVKAPNPSPQAANRTTAEAGVMHTYEILGRVENATGTAAARTINVRRLSTGYTLSGTSLSSFSYPNANNWAAQVNENGDLGSLTQRLLRYEYYLFYISDAKSALRYYIGYGDAGFGYNTGSKDFNVVFTDPDVSMVVVRPQIKQVGVSSEPGSLSTAQFVTANQSTYVSWDSWWGSGNDMIDYFYSKANVHYSVNNGPWTAIATNRPHDSFQSWTPTQVSSNVRVRVQDTLSGLSSTTTLGVGPTTSITGPTQGTNGQTFTWNASVSHSGGYSYNWYRANNGVTFSLVGSGSTPKYTGTISGSGFVLRLDLTLNGVLVGRAFYEVSCSNCGGPGPA